MDGAKKEAEETTRAAASGGGDGAVMLELPLGDAASFFDLEKAVCSHGLFMMAPNHWDSLSKTLTRPLRLHDSSPSDSLLVRISQPSRSPHCLRIRVLGPATLSPEHRKSLLGQVRRMLRLTDSEERNVREFQKIHGEAKERGFGRVFRSPTLFEDMVKCILLCNCQWSRTLSMARALCELQLELQSPSFGPSVAEGCIRTNLTVALAKTENFIPNTPAGKERKRKVGLRKCSTNLASRYEETEAEILADNSIQMERFETSESLQGTENLSPSISSTNKEAGNHDYENYNSGHILSDLCKVESCPRSSEENQEIELIFDRMGNFPSAIELAKLDEKFLAKRCNLGYRASRVVNLAKSIVDGKIQLRQLEAASEEISLTNYDELAEQLKQIDGFGPFTCANVLMCMGFYHVIPTDSETIRHLKQVHAKQSDVRRVVQDVEAIYGNYAPFQFLAYWSEIWHFYEERFGKLSEMPHSDYARITASNMRPRANGRNKRTKLS